MKMLQFDLKGLRIVVFPLFGKHGHVQCLFDQMPSESYSIPQFVEILDRVAKWKVENQ